MSRRRHSSHRSSEPSQLLPTSTTSGSLSVSNTGVGGSSAASPPPLHRVATPQLVTKDQVEEKVAQRQAARTNVRVVVRVRPMLAHETAKQSRECLQLLDDVTLHVNGQNAESARAVDRKYSYDWIFPPAADQTTVYTQSGIQLLLQSALEGYSSSVIVYGQTGSGKTYTMSGLDEVQTKGRRGGGAVGGAAAGEDKARAGLVPRCMEYLFEQMAQRPDRKFTVRASYLEIYNEKVIDLLAMDGKTLPVRLKPDEGFFVENLLVVECRSPEDLLVVVDEGHRNRHVGSHELNKDSSRSHSIMTVYVESDETNELDGHVINRFGKISFVDLAGSENVKSTKSSGVTLKESGQINKSLFYLGKVISVLGDIHTGKKPRTSHVPYRDSVLTKLLMDSLGGSGLTMIIACCSPASMHISETVRTLNYATRARNIQNRPSVRMDPEDQLILELKQDVARLRAENAHLRQLLEGAGITAPPPTQLGTLAANEPMSGPPPPPPVSTPGGGFAPQQEPEWLSEFRDGASGAPPGQNPRLMDVHHGGTSSPQPVRQQTPHRRPATKDGGMSSYHGMATHLTGGGDMSPTTAPTTVVGLRAENRRLRRKIENLERVFVTTGDETGPWTGRHLTSSDGRRASSPAASTSSSHQPDRSVSSSLFGSSSGGAGALNPYRAELDKLRALNRQVRSKNQELLQRIQVLEGGGVAIPEHSDIPFTFHAKNNVRKETHENFQLKQANTQLHRQIAAYKARAAESSETVSRAYDALMEAGYHELAEDLLVQTEDFDPLDRSRSPSPGSSYRAGSSLSHHGTNLSPPRRGRRVRRPAGLERQGSRRAASGPALQGSYARMARRRAGTRKTDPPGTNEE